ncbi:MAG: ketopantoate reductase family protein [Ktedonobacterales bacterium]
MRIAIIGAGAIGCYLGARLAQRGHDILVQGRSEQVAAISAGGLAIRWLDGRMERQPLRVITDLRAALDFVPDAILLTVKSQDVAQACAPLADYACAAPVVTLQNGVRADDLAAEVVGRDRIVGGVIMIAVAYLRPGEIEAQFPGWLTLGEPWASGVTPRVFALRGALRDAVPTYVTTDLRAARWSKLIANLNNGLCAATGSPLPEIARTPLGRRLSLALMREGAAVARAEGVRLTPERSALSPDALRGSPTTALIATLQGFMPALVGALPLPLAEAVIALTARTRVGRLPVRGSTWQSIARGRETEITYLNGEISRLGFQRGMPTPINDRVTAVVREVARTHEFVSLEALASAPSVPLIPQRAEGGNL